MMGAAFVELLPVVTPEDKQQILVQLLGYSFSCGSSLTLREDIIRQATTERTNLVTSQTDPKKNGANVKAATQKYVREFYISNKLISPAAAGDIAQYV